MVIERTTRFGVFPTLKIGRLLVIKFSTGKQKLSTGHKALEIGNGFCDYIWLNIGRSILLWETPRTLPA